MTKKIFSIDTFKKTYFFFCLLSIFPITMEITSEFSKIFLVIGLFIFGIDFFKERKIFIKKNIILLLFYISVLISAIINRSNMMANINLLLYCVVQTYVMSENNKDTYSFFEDIYIAISMIASILSLVIFFTNYKNTFTFNGSVCPFGMYEGRLFGVFSNPNVGSFVSWLGIVFSMYKIFDFQKLSNTRKTYYISSIIINYFIIALSNSRSVFIMSVITTVAFFFIIAQRFKKQLSANLIISIILSGICFFGFFGCNKVLGSLNNYLISKREVANVEQETSKETADSIDNNEQEKTENVNVIVEEHENNNEYQRDYSNQDASNGRMDIWKTGLIVSTSSPKNFIFGVGNNNIYDACLKVNGNIESVYSNMHNIYLQILVGSGVISLILFIAFFLRKFNLFVKNAKSRNNFEKSFFWLAIVVSYLISGLVDSNLLYFMNVFMTTSFWLIVGYFITFLDLE